MSDDQILAARLGEALDNEVVQLQPLSGGDTARAFRVTLADRTVVFAKTHPSPPSPGYFGIEARGLSWLGRAGQLAVPEVVAVHDRNGPDDVAFLVLTWIDQGDGDHGDFDQADAEFGRCVAMTHRWPWPTFGRPDQATTGSQALPNRGFDTWAEFYATQRLLPLCRIARNGRALPDSTVADIEQIASDLDRFGAADEPPALLHGDLWAGNRLVDRAGTSWVIDPAAHGGHREFDLAMMRLFGGFGPAAFDAYDDLYPLQDGWETRVALHQLSPLIVHAIKFGGAYVSATSRAVASLLYE